MYMLEEPYKNAEEQALTSMQELFEAVSSAKEADNQRILQGIAVAATKSPWPSLEMEIKAISTLIRHHILEFMQSEANPTFFQFLFQAR